MTPRFGLLKANDFLTFLQNERFRAAVRLHTDLEPLLAAADIEERSAALSGHLQVHWDDLRDEVEDLMRRWCDDLTVPSAQRPHDLADRLVFALLDPETHVVRADDALLHEVVAHDYAALGACSAEVAAEVRRIVPRDVWASAYLLLTPDDPPGADSTSEASLLVALCVRTGIWRLHRLLVDPMSAPPRGFAASDAIRIALHLPGRTPHP